MRQLGADDAIDYTQNGWADAVKAATDGRGADIFLDATGDTEHGSLKPLAPGGIWVLYGSQKGGHGDLGGGELAGIIGNSQTIRGCTLYSVLPDSDAIATALKDLLAWNAEGRLQVRADDRFPLAQAAEAHTAIAARRTTGKVVLEP